MPVSKKARAGDIHEIERRLEMQIHLHLLDMEENPDMYAAKDRLAAIQYIGMYLNRKFGWGDPETADVGSAVRKYAGAFKTAPHVTGGRTERARSTSVPSDTRHGDAIPSNYSGEGYEPDHGSS